MTILENIGEFDEARKSGLQALAGEHRRVISCSETRNIKCSYNVDEAFERSEPSAERWDYAIEVTADNGVDALALVEVHPANGRDCYKAVVQKARWMQNKLKLHKIKAPKALWWVKTGDCVRNPCSQYEKGLAQNGIKGPCSQTDDIYKSTCYSQV